MQSSAVVALALLESVSAFSAPAAMRTVSRASAPAMFSEGDIGVLPPLGVFDPLGLIETRDMRRYEIMEIKHGRAAMLGFLHVIAIEAGVRVPRYDKTLKGGRGDRAPEATWPTTAAAADVVLFEGWMGGFKARGDADALAKIHPGLPAVDANLRAYDARWDAAADAWLVIAIESPRDTVFGWRLQQERAAGGGLSDDEVRDFVDRFLPSYDAYCPSLYAAAAGAGVDGKPTLKLDLDASRNPVFL